MNITTGVLLGALDYANASEYVSAVKHKPLPEQFHPTGILRHHGIPARLCGVDHHPWIELEFDAVIPLGVAPPVR